MGEAAGVQLTWADGSLLASPGLCRLGRSSTADTIMNAGVSLQVMVASIKSILV